MATTSCTGAMPVLRKTQLSGSLALAVALLAGCSTQAPARPDDAQVKQFSGKGYLADDDYGIATTYASWQTGETSHDITLTVPSLAGRYPLIIYLPALGENRMAGEAWRTTWARAGYAVLCLQPLTEDARAWSSAGARAGDFALLARQRYSATAMSARLEALDLALQELVRRQAAKESPFDRADLSKVAIAGFDLGAYTAMTVAGETERDVVVPQLPISIQAVIAISPFAGFSGASFGSRYGVIGVPVLSITSDADADALGVVGSAALRKAPFEYMPPGDKYLAVLAGIPHAVFSGAGPQSADDPDQGTAPGDGAGTGQPGDGRHGGGRKAGGDAAARRSRPAGRGGWSDQPASPTARAMGVAAVQGISTAFLDTVIKQDSVARDWLEKDARKWLRDKGELKRK